MNVQVLVGTLSGEIYELSDFDGSNVHKGPIATGTHTHPPIQGGGTYASHMAKLLVVSRPCGTCNL